MLWLLFGCETEFNPGIEENPQLVVHAFLRPGTVPSVRLNESQFILDRISPNGFTYHNHAQVEISDQQGNTFKLASVGDGIYLGDFLLEAEASYFLKIESPEFPLIISQDFLPGMVEIDSFAMEKSLTNVNLDDRGYKATLSFTDPVEKDNYYAIEIIIARTGATQLFEETPGYLFTEDTKVNTSGNTDITIGDDQDPSSINANLVLFISDINLNNGENKFEFFVAPLGIRDLEQQDIYVVLKNISENYYNYLLTTSFQKEIEEEDTFVEPVQIISNISNGLGIFTAYNYDTLKATIIK